jgi:insecticidal toxin complex protein TccC
VVESVTPVDAHETVYNFEVEATHTYFVGAARVWVHNPTGGTCGGAGQQAEPPQNLPSPTQPYADFAHSFKPGDVVYGTGRIPIFSPDRAPGPRTDALVALQDQAGIRDKQNAILRHGPETAPVPYQADPNDPANHMFVTHDALNAAAYPAHNTRLKRNDDYYADSEISANAWGDVDEAARARAYRDFIAGHPKYNVADPANRVTQSVNTNLPNAALGKRNVWHHTSKAGLEFQLQHTDGAVHFIVGDTQTLDQFLQNATDKNSQYGTSVTSSEVRWLYRHRNTPEVRQRVHFWGPDGEIPQSQIFDDPRWQTYESNRR